MERNKMAFLADLKTEMKKVDWPTDDRVAQMTVAVFLIVALLTFFTFVLDLILGAVLFK
jgi:preprotein translocase SecE subunit